MSEDPYLGKYKHVIVVHYVFHICLAILSLVVCYLGYRLFLLGVTGQVEVAFQTDSVKGRIANASPGLVLALAGAAGIVVLAWRGVRTRVISETLPHLRLC